MNNRKLANGKHKCMSQLFLVVKKQDLASFVFAADREYFSKPIAVQHIYSDRITRTPYVRDDVRGHEYPVDKASLRIGANLTNAQLAMIGFAPRVANGISR